ncbi:MAG: SH3 domain-containing protein [Bacteroidota bacterium]
MQKALTLLSFFICPLLCSGQSTSLQKLEHADSLFEVKKYTESFEIYDYLLEAEKNSSPAMLLKMAFIREGLGDYSGALYYLNTYYLKTSDRRVLQKMEEMAGKRGLEGYAFTDYDFFLTNFYKYYNFIVYGLLALSILMLALVYRLKVQLKQSPAFPAIIMVIVLAGLFYTLNFGREYNRAIIISSDTYLMSGPSAGSEVVDILDKGHRLSYSSKKDVWVKVNWKDNAAYIKEDKLRYLHF